MNLYDTAHKIGARVEIVKVNNGKEIGVIPRRDGKTNYGIRVDLNSLCKLADSKERSIFY
jgi:hypothetical protein